MQRRAGGRGKPLPYITTKNKKARCSHLGNTVLFLIYRLKYRYRNVMICARAQGASGANFVALMPLVMPSA